MGARFRSTGLSALLLLEHMALPRRVAHAAAATSFRLRLPSSHCHPSGPISRKQSCATTTVAIQTTYGRGSCSVS